MSTGAGGPPHHFKIPGSLAFLQGRALGGIAKPFSGHDIALDPASPVGPSQCDLRVGDGGWVPY